MVNVCDYGKVAYIFLLLSFRLFLLGKFCKGLVRAVNHALHLVKKGPRRLRGAESDVRPVRPAQQIVGADP